ALDSIIEEGEGDRGNREDSHYGRFRKIQEEYRGLLASLPAFNPALPVLENPFARTPPLTTSPVNVFSNEDTAAASDLLDATYAAMLELLSHYFDNSMATDDTTSETLAGIAIE